jgi:signal transduction histidine kinase
LLFEVPLLRKLAWLLPRTPRLQVAFLVFSAAILGTAMALVGELVTGEISVSISRGVADTAAASMEVMLADELAQIGPKRPLSDRARTSLDAIFSSASDTRVNKLVQVELRDLDGKVFYESNGGIVDPAPPARELAAARRGKIVSSLEDMPLAPVGPDTSGVLPVLKLIIPVHSRATGAVEATAELYFAGASLVALQAQAQRRAWLIVGLIGLAAIVALFTLVDRTGRTIESQRQRLAGSLARSQRLATENTELRRQAVVANERLLAQVGSDLHDGPLQLLAAHILALSRPGAARKRTEVAVAQQAMNELRNISAGLVLPELSALDLRETIALAVRRHEEFTGLPVKVTCGDLPYDCALDLRVCLYRIIQEGLGNAARHGVLGTCALAIAIADGKVTMEITNGVTPPQPAPAPPPARPHLGIDGMRARLAAIGGHLTFENSDERARLIVHAPL